MPSLKAIRNRIASVKNSRKITRAMKLVAASKLRRAQEAILAARPYTKALTQVVSELAGVAGPESHPLFEDRGAKNVAIVVFTSDRGLAGAFNANVIKAVERFAAGELTGAESVSLRLIGKKANTYFSRRKSTIASYDEAPTGASALSVARQTATRVIDDFLSGKVDRVYVVYNEFKSAISQTTTVQQILPVVPPERPVAQSAGGEQQVDFIYEPGKDELLQRSGCIGRRWSPSPVSSARA
jgi:F-type H+-transporting ATPase subunit gamma